MLVLISTYVPGAHVCIIGFKVSKKRNNYDMKKSYSPTIIKKEEEEELKLVENDPLFDKKT
jgi:hypothetical protein